MSSIIKLNHKRRSRHSPEIAVVEVYDGRRQLGTISESRGAQYEASTADGVDLGNFDTAEAASHALILAARSRSRESP